MGCSVGPLLGSCVGVEIVTKNLRNCSNHSISSAPKSRQILIFLCIFNLSNVMLTFPWRQSLGVGLNVGFSVAEQNMRIAVLVPVLVPQCNFQSSLDLPDLTRAIYEFSCGSNYVPNHPRFVLAVLSTGWKI